MKHTRSPRDLWASLLPLGGAAIALAAVWRLPALASGGPLTPGLLVVLLLAGAAAAFHRPFVAASTVGLGALVLPSALLLGGGIHAASLAASSLLLAELVLRLIRRRAVYGLPDRRSPLRTFEATGRAALATLAAGGVWAWLHLLGLPLGMTGAAAAYLLLWAGLEIADQKIRRPDQALRWKAVLPPLALDAFGWALGGALAAAGLAAGWTVGGLLTAGAAVLALEAARNRVLHQRSHFRARDMERLSRAAKRIVDKDELEVAEVAERIRAECVRVVRAFWYQFELLVPGSQFKSWWSGPDGALREGVPEPERYPPALPGVHRRAPWNIVERHLRSEGKVLARLRLWCDPRLLDPQGVELELLDKLIPQATVSLQRCLASRESREDALTGAVLRRVLEKRLHEVHSQCIDQGDAMAVLLCDLDHFKKINDTWGHAAGDEALKAAAGVLKATREGALCCRYGGEEFALLLEAYNGEEALAVAEGVRQRVESLVFTWEGQRIPLTLSAGVASFPELHIKTAAELLLFADEALYEAKRRGRNRVLLDIGQGRYQDPEGALHQSEEVPPVAEPPRIFV